ncbi:tetratricopeptide repeat protein [Embleya sp. NPDC020630]|uniref:tetratricopeptide repeat protein n=1 Tax=Embleya sp. NPDC020630 TaxID=3363979 RepID=UPI0037AF0848
MTAAPAEGDDRDRGAPGVGGVRNEVGGGVFFHAVIQGRDVTVRLPPRIEPALSGLPAPSPAFTGRDTHLDRLLEDLAPGRPGAGAVLVTAVAGLAGIGKTELAVQAAARALREPGWFPGGALFADLFGYDPERRVTPARALDGWLRALGIPGEHVPAETDDRARLFRSVLATYAREGRRVLVIVDNASTAEQARPLLPTDGTTTALVTSRHTLDLDARLHDLDTLADTDAVELLRRSLLAARGPHDTRVDDEPDAATAVAHMCAGLPLALHIAAALLADTPTRPLATLAAALTGEHTRLKRLRREDRAVRAAFDLSYRHLDSEHAHLFRLLPLNPGPDISTEAAAHLAHTDVGESALYDTEELLQDLARAHLLEPAPTWGRWRMHDLVRLHADEHGHTHTGTDQRPQALIRLHTHYRTTTEAAATHLETLPGPRDPRFPDRAHALTWLDAEHPALIAVATATPPLGHPETTTTLALALAEYLDQRRLFDDWITVTTAALAIHRELGDRHSEGEAWNNLGIALREVRRFEEAIDAHTTAAAIHRELGDRHGEGRAWNNLGLALREVRRFEEAIDAHRRDLRICRKLGDRHGEGRAWNNLGIALREVRRFEEAIDAHTAAATVHRELGDRHGEGGAWNNLGLALREVRRFEEAIDAHTAATTVHRELGDRHGEGTAWNNLGLALEEVRRFEEAIDAHTTAATIHRELGDRHGEGMAWNNLGIALRQVRRFEEAIDAHTTAATIHRELGDRHGEGKAWNNLGLALQRVRRFDEAIDAHRRDLRICQELGDRHGEGTAWNNLGIALRWVRRFEEAVEAHTAAATAFRELGDRHAEQNTLMSRMTAKYEFYCGRPTHGK